jgi:hypothetical protein
LSDSSSGQSAFLLKPRNSKKNGKSFSTTLAARRQRIFQYQKRHLSPRTRGNEKKGKKDSSAEKIDILCLGTKEAIYELVKLTLLTALGQRTDSASSES